MFVPKFAAHKFSRASSELRDLWRNRESRPQKVDQL